jgi:hypothetical protein
MKSSLQVARILTWLNLIVWGGMLAFMLLFGLAARVAPMVIAVFLFSAIPLHSYASLKLQKSIRHAQLKLSNQTPVGVRFIGFVALFFGLATMANAYFILQDPKTTLESMKASMADTKGITSAELMAVLKAVAVFIMLMGLSVVVNVILNMRLLRWYYLVKQSDVS